MTVPTPAGYVVAADVGGTLTKVALAYGDKTTSPAIRFPTQRENGRVSVSWLATTLRDAIDPRLSERCMGVAVAVPGIVDVAAGTVLAAPNLGWVDLPRGSGWVRGLGAESGAGLRSRSH